jgi:hypothetical protein
MSRLDETRRRLLGVERRRKVGIVRRLGIDVIENAGDEPEPGARLVIDLSDDEDWEEEADILNGTIELFVCGRDVKAEIAEKWRREGRPLPDEAAK